MIKLFMATLGMFLAPQAAIAGEWVIRQEEKLEASDPASIQALVDRFPELRDERGEELELLKVHFRLMSWKGNTICRAGDPRLVIRLVDAESRTKPGPNGEQSAMMGSMSGLSDRDPCLEDLPPDGRWVLQRESFTEYRSQRELASFLEKRKSSFPDTKPEELEYASERPQTWRWEGKTRCAPSDPRLTREVDAGEVRFHNQGGLGSAFDVDDTRDPCAG